MAVSGRGARSRSSSGSRRRPAPRAGIDLHSGLVRTTPTRRLLLALTFLLGSAVAQTPARWQVPPRGGVIYQRQAKERSEVQEPAGRRISMAPWGTRAAAMLLASELDERQEHARLPLVDLRDLLATMAFDLRGPGAAAPHDVGPFHRRSACRVRIVRGAPDAEGWATHTATLEPRPLPPDSGFAHLTLPAVRGTAEVRRHFDPARGVVDRFTGRLDLELVHADAASSEWRRGTVTVTEDWTFDLAVGPDDVALGARVNDAIRRGKEHLRAELRRQKLLPPRGDGADRRGAGGELALALLTLVKCGHGLDDALVAMGFADLRRRELRQTYELALAILAMEALHAPPGERDALHAGTLERPWPRRLSPEDLQIVRDWTTRLLDNADATVDRAYLRRWRYQGGPGWDNSNNQYAMLGLYAAQLCGVDFSPQVWTAAANHWLEVMTVTDPTPAVPRLLSAAERRREATGERIARTGTPVPEVAWGYTTGPKVFGSMTAGAVAGLAICASGLRMQGKGDPGLLRRIDDAQRGGLRWLGRHLSVRGNPGSAWEWAMWEYYWLYGLERACELSRVAVLDDRDWYCEGALQILGQQGPQGQWARLDDTCFALLFLQKATLPPITPR